MKLDEIWDEIWTRTKYFYQDAVVFLFQLLIIIVGYSIIIVWNAKEFFERRRKKWKDALNCKRSRTG